MSGVLYLYTYITCTLDIGELELDLLNLPVDVAINTKASYHRRGFINPSAFATGVSCVIDTIGLMSSKRAVR